MGPELVLGDARPHLALHLRHAGLADRNRGDHAGDLVVRLDGTGQFHHLLAIVDFPAQGFQFACASDVEMVGGDAPVGAGAGFAHDRVELGRPLSNPLGDAVAGAEEGPDGGRADVADRFQVPGEMQGAAVFEERAETLRRNPAVAVLVVQDPDLHVAGAVGVTHVDRIVEQDAGEIALLQHLLHTAQPVGPHPPHVDLGLGIVLEDARRIARQTLRFEGSFVHGNPVATRGVRAAHATSGNAGSQSRTAFLRPPSG